jgi:hypothetical protein
MSRSRVQAAAAAPVPTRHRPAHHPRAEIALRLQRSAGNARAARRIQRVAPAIVQTGEMTGDQFAVAVALMADPERRLVLVNVPPERNRVADMLAFYTRECGIAEDRISVTDRPLKEIFARKPGEPQTVASVGDATNAVGAAFRLNPNFAERVRAQWLPSLSEDDARRLIKEWNIPLDRPVVVVWSRQSGREGGLHRDLDSSYHGLGQLARRFGEKGYTVILAGDEGEARKITANRRPEYAGAIPLGKFWASPEWGEGRPRSAQFAFFEHLRGYVPRLTHVGMRSGNLEGYAYMGQRVIFLEQEGRTDAERMDKLVKVPALSYRTKKLTTVPTRAGRAVAGRKEVDELIKHLATFSKEYNKATAKGNEGRKDYLLKQERDLAPLCLRFVESPPAGGPDHAKKQREYAWLKANANLVPRDVIEPKESRGFTERDVNAIEEMVEEGF